MTGGRQRLSWLDRIRGVSIAWIFLVHFIERFMAGSFFGNPDGSWPPLAERISQLRPLPVSGAQGVFVNGLRYVGWLGDQGVQVLLVASGFGLALGALKSTRGLETSEYFTKRVARILPLWVAAHVVFMFAGVVFSSGLSVADWRTWGSLCGLRFMPQVFYYFAPAWWYVGLLLQLYLLFPLLYRYMRKAGPVRFFLVVGGLSLVVRAVGLVTLREHLDWWSRGAVFVSRLPEFAFGMAFAHVYARDPERLRRWARGFPTTLFWVGIYMLGNVLSFTLLGMTVSFLMTGAAAFILMHSLFSLVSERRFAPVVWMGRYSYSIFLVHHPVLLFLVPGVIALDDSGKMIAFVLMSGVGSLVGAVSLEALTAWVSRLWLRARGRWGVSGVAAGVFLTLVLGCGALVSLETVVRAVAPQEVLGWGERESLEPDQLVGYRLKPDTVTRLRWQSYDYLISANSLGFPGPLYPAAKPDGTCRILVTGDAFESAEGVDTPKSWPRILETRLNESGNSSLRHEVLNFAVTGWGPNQYEAVVTSYAPRFSPDLILIGFFVNDYSDVRMTDEELRLSIGFGQPSQTGLRSYLGLKHLRGFIGQNVVAWAKELIRGEPYGPGYFFGNFDVLERKNADGMHQNAILVEKRLRSIRSKADEIGARIILVMVPAPVQVCGRESLKYYPKRIDLSDGKRFDLEQPQRITRSICEATGIEYLDLRQPLASEADAVYQPKNMHFTERGHEVVAMYVARQLLDRGYVR